MELNGTDELKFARQKLEEVLGEKTKTYFHQLTRWFRMEITKTQFDQEARKLFNDKHIRYHNVFLITFLNKCQQFATTDAIPLKSDNNEILIREKLKKGQIRKKAKLERSTYDPPNIRDYIPESIPFPAQILSESPRYCGQEGLLPEKALIYGRLLLAAWDYDLKGAEDTAANLIVSASKMFLKNIILSIIKLRKVSKEKDGQMLGFSPNALNYFSANSSRIYGERKIFDDDEMPIDESVHSPKYFSTVEEKKQNEALEEACTIEAKPKYKINSFDLYTTLKEFPEVIPSNTIYQINMQRIIGKLYHNVDIEDNELNKSET